MTTTACNLSGLLRAWRWCALAALGALLAACGGGGGGGSGEPAPTGPQGQLRSAAEGELVAYFQQRLARGAPAAPQVLVGAASATETAAPLTGTLLQEAGVDEDDLLKADGAMLYALHPSRIEAGARAPAQLQVARIRADGAPETVGRVDQRSDFRPTGMYVAGGQLAILSQGSASGGVQPLPATLLPQSLRGKTAVDVYATREAALPTLRHRVELDGELLASRRIGDVLYLVTTWWPELPAPTPSSGSGTATVTLAALLPKVRPDGAEATALVRETDCYLQPDNASLALQLTTIVAIDLASAGLQRSSRCFVGDASTLYMSQENLYLASSRQFWIAAANTATVFPREVTTDIHKFSLRRLQVDYRGSGQAAGHLGWDPERMPYRMSEFQGDLRVLTFTGQTGWFGLPAATTPTTQPSPATVTVLREDPAKATLAVVATLPNAQRPQPIGKAGEQVYAVHFAGPRAYVVTFRRIDPLYVLDLSVPADPRTAGELAMPGYSDYLYPLANGRLFGVGRDASDEGFVRGLKFALFDVADATRPRVLASRTLGSAGSASALERTRHGINVREADGKARIAVPVFVTDAPNLEGVRTAYQGLARFEVDTAQGTLAERPTMISARLDGSGNEAELRQRLDLAAERSVQGALGAYYMTGGQLLFAAP